MVGIFLLCDIFREHLRNNWKKYGKTEVQVIEQYSAKFSCEVIDLHKPDIIFLRYDITSNHTSSSTAGAPHVFTPTEVEQFSKCIK